MRIAFLAVDTRWEDPAGDFASFSYAARKLEASVRSAPDLSHVETEVIDLASDDPDAFFEAIRDSRPDLVAASSYIWSVASFLEVARRVKEWDPRVRFVLGGPAARASLLSLEPYRSNVKHVDAIATGEGEEVIRALARDADGTALGTIPGLLLPHALGLRATSPAVRPELDAYPSPYQIGTVPADHTGFIETFRGCPISCAFCQWGDERSDRVYGAEYLASHLRGVLQARATSIFFTDAAFNLSARAFKNLMEAEREVGALARLSVHGHFYPTHLKDEHLEFLARVGKAQVSIGVQTFDPEVLRKLGRPFDLVRFERVLRELRGRIPIDVELIFGLPGDNPDSFRRTLEKTKEIADSVRVFYPLVLPDALLERADEFGIRFDPKTFVIEECAGWTARELREGWEEVVRGTEGLANRIVRSTWVGFGTHDQSHGRRRGQSGGRDATAMRPEQVEMLGATLGARVEGWSVASGRREDDALLLDLGSPGGSVVLEVFRSRDGARFFTRHDGVAYSYRGALDREASGELARVIEVIHPATARLLARTGS
jgi:radical SAM superfamily enzyme YgiQ (UPF0313 family)